MAKLNVIRAKVLEAATSAALEAALSDFLAGKGSFSGASPEREFVSVQLFVPTSTVWAALVLYTE